MNFAALENLEAIIAGLALLIPVVLGLFVSRRKQWLGLSIVLTAGVIGYLVVPLLHASAAVLVDTVAIERIIVAGCVWACAVALGVVVIFKNNSVVRVSLLAVTLATTSVFGWIVIPQWQVSRNVFVDGPVARPTVLGTSSTPKNANERFNVLLLGGDAGPGRWGLRTDAMHLVSMDASLDPRDGAVVISIPRNLMNAPMPQSLQKQFPNGFDKIANALFGWGDEHPTEVEGALGATDEPGASVVAAMVAEFTGLRVDGWILTDMRGFINLVDSAGGVDIWVDKKIRAPGSAFGILTPAHDFAAGWQRMDGADALSFARARKQDSDYHRMARQRCVLASLAAQMELSKLIARWPLIATTIAHHVRTNLTPVQVGQLQKMVGLTADRITALSLAPPYVDTGLWDLDEVRTLVQNAVYGTHRPVALPTGEKIVTNGETSMANDPRWNCKVERVNR